MVERINRAILDACIRTDHQIGLEFSVCMDESTSMYGEPEYNVLYEGAIEASFSNLDLALAFINKFEV